MLAALVNETARSIWAGDALQFMRGGFVLRGRALTSARPGQSYHALLSLAPAE